ncbi:glycosyltransferase family 1 protein [Aspergillus heterothallicus]
MVANPVSTSKPIVVISCPPATGHTNPLLAQSTHLVSRGFEVHFIAGPESEHAILKTGAAFYPVHSTWSAEKHEQMMAIPEGPERFIFGLKGHFVDVTPNSFPALVNVLEAVKEKSPDRDVVILQESAAMSVGPFFLGAPLPKGYTSLPKIVTFSTVPLVVSSLDHPPFGPGLPPDASDEGRARNRAMYDAGKPLWDAVAAYVTEVYATLGATRAFSGALMDSVITNADVYLQSCSQSLEHPRSDLPANIRFVGAHPRKEITHDIALPAWWGEMLAAKKEGKKVVFVTQGTFQVDYGMLVKPTIEALAGRQGGDCFVIAALGVRGATLEGFTLPENARVVDYLLYDAVLPHVDVFVSNAGYGGFLHGVMHGVPMVLGGMGQDKAEVCARGQWAGIAINLKTDTPTVEAIRDAVNTVLTEPKYKERCVEIQRENEALDSRAQVERAILEFARP